MTLMAIDDNSKYHCLVFLSVRPMTFPQFPCCATYFSPAVYSGSFASSHRAAVVQHRVHFLDAVHCNGQCVNELPREVLD